MLVVFVLKTHQLLVHHKSHTYVYIKCTYVQLSYTIHIYTAMYTRDKGVLAKKHQKTCRDVSAVPEVP